MKHTIPNPQVLFCGLGINIKNLILYNNEKKITFSFCSYTFY